MQSRHQQYVFFFHPPPHMPNSLYIDSASASFFHPLWHRHSCLCCRGVVAIELLWLRDSLIVRMDGLVVKSIQCSEWFFTLHKTVSNIAVIVKSNWQSIRVWEVAGRNLLGGAIQPLLTLGVGVSRSGVGWGTSVIGHGTGGILIPAKWRNSLKACCWSKWWQKLVTRSYSHSNRLIRL